MANESRNVDAELNKDSADETKRSKNKKKSSRSGQRRYKDHSAKDKNDISKKTETLGNSTNDPEWYLKDPTYALSVSKLLYSKPTGDLLPSLFTYSDASGATVGRNVDGYKTEPGIVVYEDMATWGGIDGAVPLSENDVTGQAMSLNVIGAKIMQFMQTFNSRSYTYQKSDVFKYLMCVDQLAIHIMEAVRVYKYAYSLSPSNRYFRKIVTSLGWNVNDVINNLPKFKSDIIYCTNLYNRFYIPSIFAMTLSHFQHYSQVYADQPDLKGQLYAYAPHGFWYYSSKHTQLNYVNCIYVKAATISGNADLDWRYGVRNPLKWMDIFMYLFQKVYNDETFSRIQSDLLRSFGESSLGKLLIDLDGDASPVYDEEENFKLHNASQLQYFEDDLYYRTNGSGDVHHEWRWALGTGQTVTKCGTVSDEVVDTDVNSNFSPSSMIYRDSLTVNGDIIGLVGTCFSRPTINRNDTSIKESLIRHNLWDTSNAPAGAYAYEVFRTSNGSRYFDLPAGAEGSPAEILVQHVYDHVVNNSTMNTKWNFYDTTTDARWSAAVSSFVLGPGHMYCLGELTKFRNTNEFIEGVETHFIPDPSELRSLVTPSVNVPGNAGASDFTLGIPLSMVFNMSTFGHLPCVFIGSGYFGMYKRWDTTNVIEETYDERSRILRSIIISLLTISLPGGANESRDTKFKPRH